MKISLVNRFRMQGHYSIESYFNRIAHQLRMDGVDVISCTSPYPSKGLVSRLRTIRFASCHQSDITHVTGDIHFAALATNPRRTVVTVHDCGRLHQLSGLKREVLRQLWFQKPLMKVAAITVISQSVKDDLLAWVPSLDPSKVHIVPVSISCQFKFSPALFRRRKPRILQIGTNPNKNLPRLIEALKGMDVTLVIVGRLSQELLHLLSKYNICYESHCDLSDEEIVDLYKRSDILSIVSTLEGFGMPILEAQAIGRPVLTSNRSSMPEVAGKGALQVDPTSVAAIRVGLCRLIDDAALRDSLIAFGKANVERFSTNAISAQYLRIYRSILNDVP